MKHWIVFAAIVLGAYFGVQIVFNEVMRIVNYSALPAREVKVAGYEPDPFFISNSATTVGSVFRTGSISDGTSSYTIITGGGGEAGK